MSTPLKAFKASRLFDPHYLNKVKPQNVALNSLSVLPFVTEPIMAQLNEEYQQYTAAVEDLSPVCEIVTLWNLHANNIPRMVLRYYCFSRVLLLLNVYSLFSRTLLGISNCVHWRTT